jgi:DNA-binding transcriptional LysR family regulator
MDLRELVYFIAVYEERSVTAAARRCFISQPSVSASIASLEHELDAKLFLRHRKGATPTAAAERVYPMARRLVDDAAALKTAFRARETVERVSVGLMPSLDVERTRELLAAMTRARGVSLEVVGEDERCDLRVVSKTLVRKGETFTPLWSERFVVALPSTHPLAARSELRSSDLAGEKVVERCHCEHARHFARGRRRLQTAAVARSEEWALALVSAGVGIAIVPEGSVRDDARVAIRALSDVNVSRQVGLAYRARGPLSAAVLGLVDDVRRRFGR